MTGGPFPHHRSARPTAASLSSSNTRPRRLGCRGFWGNWKWKLPIGDCSPASYRLVEVIDTAKTDAFFQRHEILETPDAKNFLSKPPHYASKYQLYITAKEVLYFLKDTLVIRMVDLEPGQKCLPSAVCGVPIPSGKSTAGKIPGGGIFPGTEGRRETGACEVR